MKEIGIRVFNMEKDNNYLKMDQYIRDSSKMEKDLE